ncbi:alanine racemase [Psychrobacillus vulpis]|uniref:Amino acid deaminase/aldolase n=1 Tax=Psychrobacillus vulpis TaxID=2325572 RepID=A0A544TPW4_9BACI|nr:alanine racemase [Psychrobacillus vulpis]TQR19480.1 amino acid deaminase/aldolase [Psychrobacillus vulpis]
MNDFINAYNSIQTPFAWVDLNALDYNIRFINEKTINKKVRVATKSVRSVEMLKYLESNLQRFNGWMTFSTEETLFLLEQNFDDFLIGYPQLDKLKVVEIIPYILKGKKIVFMVDDLTQLQFLDSIGKEHNVIISICIDINVSKDFKLIYFGTKRSSLHNITALEELLDRTKALSNIQVVGVMGYEAQIAGVGDRPAQIYKKPIIQLLKNKSYRSISTFRKEAVRLVRSYYPLLEFVNGGGSGSIAYTCTEEEVSEITIGSAFYAPTLFSRYDSLKLQPAAGFALQVTRKPENQIIVCHGGGYIASGAIGEDKQPEPYYPTDLKLLKLEGAGEVQTPLYDPRQKCVVGDVVYFRHAKAGELCERFNQLYLSRDGQLKSVCNTYRGDGKCFL